MIRTHKNIISHCCCGAHTHSSSDGGSAGAGRVVHSSSDGGSGAGDGAHSSSADRSDCVVVESMFNSQINAKIIASPKSFSNLFVNYSGKLEELGHNQTKTGVIVGELTTPPVMGAAA